MSLHDDCAESLTTDQAFDLLGDGTRRRALAALQETDGAMSLDRLAEATACRAEGVTPGEVSADRWERTAASLHHCHLPKLADAGIVEYDLAENQVEPTGEITELEPYFELIETEETDGSDGLRRD
jgi:hypothetical protein